MVLFESAAPDPTADYYTQQYQRYLEHVCAWIYLFLYLC